MNRDNLLNFAHFHKQEIKKISKNGLIYMYFVTRIKICRIVREISFVHSPSLTFHIKIFHPYTSIYEPNSPVFSSILYPSPSTHLKNWLFSTIHLLIIILFSIFPILIILSSFVFSQHLSFTIFFFTTPSLIDYYASSKSFAHHNFILFNDIILCFTTPSLLKFVMFLSIPKSRCWASGSRATA